MAQTFEEGNKSPHSSLWKEMPSSGEGGAEGTVWGGRSPEPRLPAQGSRQHPPPPPPHLRAAQHPAPGPWPGHPGLQPWGLRSGEGHLWWFAWRGRGEGEGRSPKWAWRRA